MAGNTRIFVRSLDLEDFLIVLGYACIVVGVGVRYDWPLALIVFGVGLLLVGCMAIWRNA